MHRPVEQAALDYIDLADGLNYLSPRQRMAVLLYSQGMTQTEIAADAGVTQAAVNKLLLRSFCVMRGEMIRNAVYIRADRSDNK